MVKNTLTQRAADQAGAEALKELLEGPTAFTFVPTATWRWPRRRSRTFRRETDVLAFKGGVMDGEPSRSTQLEALASLPARDVLHGQLVGMIASPITGLVRGLNALIAGLAIQLGQIAEQGLVGGEPRGGRGAGRGGGRGELPPRRQRPRGAGGREAAAAEEAAAEEEAPAEEAGEAATRRAAEPAADAEERLKLRH